MVKKTNKYILIGAILVVIIVGIVVAFFINNNNKNKKTEVEAVSSEALLLVAASDKVEVQAVASLDELITGADKPILIDFWAEWCAPL